MTIGNALAFIKRGLDDNALRSRLNAAGSSSEMDSILAEEKLLFSANDFDEAFHYQLTMCREEEEADQLREFRMWWDLLHQIVEPGRCGNRCSGCC